MANAQALADIANNSLNALTLAQQALTQATDMLKAAGIDTSAVQAVSTVPAAASPAANRSTKSQKSQPAASASGRTSSGGRTAGPEQLAIREKITAWASSDDAGLFTVKSMTAFLGDNKIQVRNAINALTDSGLLMRWSEKFSNSPGAREVVYKPTAFDVGI